MDQSRETCLCRDFSFCPMQCLCHRAAFHGLGETSPLDLLPARRLRGNRDGHRHLANCGNVSPVESVKPEETREKILRHPHYSADCPDSSVNHHQRDSQLLGVRRFYPLCRLGISNSPRLAVPAHGHRLRRLGGYPRSRQKAQNGFAKARDSWQRDRQKEGKGAKSFANCKAQGKGLCAPLRKS